MRTAAEALAILGGSQEAVQMSAKVYVTYHKKAHIIRNSILEPIQVGKGKDILGCELRDNRGENISDRNNRYCEMTAAYWARQNAIDYDYIGLLHYRRFFDFRQCSLSVDQWGVTKWPGFTSDFESRFGLDQETIVEAICDYDIVLPKKWNVQNAGLKNIAEHYSSARYHHKSDLLLCRDAVARLCPEYLPFWREYLKGHEGWFNNMFVLRKEIFINYIDWLFPILEEVERLIPFECYNDQESRVLGYLAERLQNVWLLHYMEKHPEAKVLELDRIFIEDTAPKERNPRIAERDSKSTISVVIASDDNYVPHLGALICSIFDNINEGAAIDLIVLDGGITEANKRMLKALIPEDSCLHFIPMQDEFGDSFTHMHFSRATFYRLILDKLLQSREKVIYVDCDTICLGDLLELWKIDLGGRPVAAVHDYIMEYFCSQRVLSADFTGSRPALSYLQEYVGILPHNCNKYFQAGVLIMDLQRIREMRISERMTDSLQKERYWFLDQDVLNKYLCGLQLELPAEWNFINCTDEITQFLEKSRARELLTAKDNPKLIHYAGYESKPWVNQCAYLSEYYFYYLRQTYWYEKVLSEIKLKNTALGGGRSKKSRVRRVIRGFWRRLPWYVRRLANPIAFSLQRSFTRG